jgi:hydroxymethylglutaryl-CoA lyase
MKDAMKATLDIVAAARKEGINVRAYASLAFGCPFEGKVPAERVVDLVTEYESKGANKIILADTLGVGVPEQVRSIVSALVSKNGLPSEKLGLHLHDSHSRAHENVIEGWAHGIRDFDAAIGGCGGCNFAPGSKGNISIEKLLRTLASINGAKHNIDVQALHKANTSLGAVLHRSLERGGELI